MVLEALGHGRHVLWSYPFPGCLQTTSVAEARDEIFRLYTLHQQKQLQINWAGPLAITEGGYRPQHLKQDILRRLQHIQEN